MRVMEMRGTNALANLHWRFREMKKSKVISLVLLPFLVLALTLIASGNVSAHTAQDFLLTNEELPPGWTIYSSIFTPWPHLAVREDLMGGSWTAEKYEMEGRGTSTVLVGYYSTEEEAKKVMHSDVYIIYTDPYTKTGTTLLEWAQESTEYVDHSFPSCTAYGDEGFTAQTTYSASVCEKDCVRKTHIFRIGNVIFQVCTNPKIEGALKPLLGEKARRLLGSVVADSDGDGVPNKIDKCPKTPPDTIVDDNGCPAKYDCDDNYVCDHDKGENCEICPKECPCNPGEKCDPSDSNADPWGCVAVAITDSDGDGVPDGDDQCLGTPAGVAVDDKGCPIGMQLSVSTDKKTYSPGETVIVNIRGSVWDAKGGLTGASIAVDVSGTKLSATTDSSGKYKCEFPLPPEVTRGTYTVTATASYSGYPSVSKSTSFAVGAPLIVEISTDKENYLIGETVYCTITVKDAATGKLVPYANLKTIATHLKSGKATELSGFTDGLGQNLLSFTWGKKESGEVIIEGKLKIEVTASKEGYADGYESIILSGCGDLECAEVEDCFDCFEDCKCGANEICDPLSKYTDPKTKCSPKVAYIFISNDPELGAAQRLKMLPRINHIRKYYQSLGYKTSTVYVDDIHDVARYLSRPSTKAIAYFGHATKPSIEHSPPGDIQNNILQQFRVNYGAKYPDLKEEIKNKAKERAAHPDLDYAYMFTCHSLDDTSLRDYLLHSGGTYWGDKGKLYGLWGLQESDKP